jgi:hypothetical protein
MSNVIDFNSRTKVDEGAVTCKEFLTEIINESDGVTSVMVLMYNDNSDQSPRVHTYMMSPMELLWYAKQIEHIALTRA